MLDTRGTSASPTRLYASRFTRWILTGEITLNSSLAVRLDQILLEHAPRGEERPVQADGVAHDVNQPGASWRPFKVVRAGDPTRPFHFPISFWNDAKWCVLATSFASHQPRRA